MTNTNWEEEFDKEFVVEEGFVNIPDGRAVICRAEKLQQFISSLLEQEKIKWLEALPKERDGQCVDPKYYISSGWKDRNQGWNHCLQTIKQQLSK
jgi:hypothetical protein